MNHPRILGIGTANAPVRLTQEQSFHAAGDQGERIRKIFLNSDIEHRHCYLEGALTREESSDQLNQRYLRGAMKTGCRAILNCVKTAGTTVQDVVPQGADVYLMCGVIHDWDDNRAITILRNCRRAMTKKSRLLLVDMIVPDRTSASFSKLPI